MSTDKAEFLWPADEDSVEEAGFEFANAETPAYQEQWWNILKDRIKEDSHCLTTEENQ